MSYTLHFSDPNTNTTIVVPSKSVSSPGINDYSTSLELVGAGYQNYGLPTAQNFLKLLENFASPTQPNNAIKGQLWYDTSNPLRPILRVNNGNNTSGRWPTASGVYQQVADPSIRFTNIDNGDIWVDTGNNQLKIRFENEWTIVGPNIQTGAEKTGSEISLLDTNNSESFPVILNWANGKIVEIISYNAFTPRTVIDGFPTIKAGINITSKISAKYNGVAERALSLELSTGVTLSPGELLKNKATSQIHTGTLYIEGSEGLYIRPTSSSKSIKLYADTINNGYVNYIGSTLKVGTQDTAYLKFNSAYTSVGVNKSPTSDSPALDVNGGGRFTGPITLLSSATNSLSVNSGATFNGTIISKGIIVQGPTTSTGKLTLGASGSGVIIDPAISDVYDIGSPYKKFRAIYVSDIIGTTQLSGNITGSAASLTTPRAFNIKGQVTATSVTFNGTTTTNFVTTLTRSAINDQSYTATPADTQTLLVLNTATTTSQLEKISKKDFLSDIYPLLFTTGMITVFGTSTNIPSGFLKCDGISTSSSLYPALYSVIGTTYGAGGPGSFKTPDLTTSTRSGSGIYLTYIIKT